MKKTFTVNLGSRVFQIDEDAYHLLDNYLNNLKLNFSQEDEGEEIVNDMESRISELFIERLSTKKEVIDIADVEEIILQMGKPEEITDDQESANSTKKRNRVKPIKKKLFRDPEDKKIGGVCSGLAAYTGFDVIAIRLLTIILAFGMAGTFFFVYLACWFIIPLARTTADKLAMRGLEVNLENIGKSVTDEANKEQYNKTDNEPQSVFKKFLSSVIQILVVIFKVILVILVLCCTPVIFAVLAICFAMLMAVAGVAISIPAFFVYSFPTISNELMLMPQSSIILIAVTGILVVLLPIIGLFYVILRHLRRCKSISTISKTVLFIIWIVSLGLCIYGLNSCAVYL